MLNVKKPYLSCIVLTADSQNGKGGSIRHVIASLVNQDCVSFEILIVDNGEKHVQKLLQNNISKRNQQRHHPILIKIVRPKSRLSGGGARNFGAQHAQGRVLLFIDDDTIPVSTRALSHVIRSARRARYGFGAFRTWTLNNTFQHRATFFLNQMLRGDTASLLKNSGKPESVVRGDEDTYLGQYSFIGNFGFCHADLFHKVGGFAEYPNTGYEDDWLMFKLYKATKKYSFLGTLRVIHVNHPMYQSSRPSLYKYLSALIGEGVYWFHVRSLFVKNLPKDKLIIEPLREVHYDHRLEAAFLNYQQNKPLHLLTASGKRFGAWVKHEQLTKEEFARCVDLLGQHKSFDDIVRHSGSDVDSLAPVIRAGLRERVLRTNSRGQLEPAFSFRFTSDNLQPNNTTGDFEAESKYNQFPCDVTSRKKRLDWIKQRYPYAEFLRMALIGDDDQVASLFATEYWARLVVVEKDPRIVKLTQQKNPNALVIRADVANTSILRKVPKVETFMTDPPYTYHGALAFIIAGLELLKPDGGEREFYVVLNPTMMGDRLDRLVATLSMASVTLSEVHQAFSAYQLPPHFAEFRRAQSFVKGLSGSRLSVQYSSCSSLYVFRTQHPRINRLRTYVNKKLMYNHFV